MIRCLISMQCGPSCVADLTEEEEACCQDADIHVAVNAKGGLCGVSKSKSTPISPGKLLVRLLDIPLQMFSENFQACTITASFMRGIDLIAVYIQGFCAYLGAARFETINLTRLIYLHP